MNDSFELDAAANGSEADLDLLAFCYLTGELLQVDRQAFEQRLATEQPLREALARAVEVSVSLGQANSVELNRTVSGSSHLSPSQSSHATVPPRVFERWMRVTSYLAIASAACLAVVIGVRAIPRAWQNQSLSPETALAWSQVRDSWPESPVAEVLGSASVAADSASVIEGELNLLGEEPGEEELNSELPAWLLTAVAGPAEPSTNDEAETPEANEDTVPVEREEL